MNFSASSGSQGTYFYQSSIGVNNWGGIGNNSFIEDITGTGQTAIFLSSAREQGGAGTVWVIPTTNITWGSTRYDINALASAGKAYHIYGRQSGTNSFEVKPISTDMNGDGIKDLVLTCSNCTADPSFGSVWVLYGGAGVLGNMNLSTFSFDGNNGFRITGYLTNLQSADLNGDGITDLIISNYSSTDPAGDAQAGHVYVLYGHKHGNFANPFALSTID